MRLVSMRSTGNLSMSLSMHTLAVPVCSFLAPSNCSSDESDGQSEDEVPDQAPQRSASKKVLSALAFCGSLGKWVC